MRKVDFGYVDAYGATLYHCCIQGYVSQEKKRIKLTPEEISQRSHDNLFYLIEKGDQHYANLPKILSKPNQIGETVFTTMTFVFGVKAITKFLLKWNIEINIVQLDFTTCNLMILPELNEIFLAKKMNPKIIDGTGRSPLDFLEQSSIFISPKLRKLIDIYPNAVYFSTVPQICNIECKTYCKSKMEPFRIGTNTNGEYITANDSTRIGQGGFGTVFRGEWHNRDSAFKYILIRDEANTNLDYVHEAYNHFNKNIIEYREQLDVSKNPNSGVIIPTAFYRQQLQSKNDNGNLVAFNYNVFVYPLYDCNLHELHSNHFDMMTTEVKLNIIDQCFTRYPLYFEFIRMQF